MAARPIRLIPTALTSVGAVQAWLAGNGLPGQSALTEQQIADYTNLINAASRAILSWTSRDSFLVRSVTEVRDGMGTCSLMLADWPVLSVDSLTVGVQSVSAQTGFGSAGYLLEAWDGYAPGRPQLLSVSGYQFPRGPGGVTVGYTVGYATQNELQTADPNDGSVWPMAPQGAFAADWKVFDKTGAPMVKVSANPSVGQYIAPKDQTEPYLFNTGQGDVVLNYSFIPAEVDYACAKWVGEWVRYRPRIGQRSATQGGQITSAFIIEQAPQDVKLILTQFNKTLTV